MPSKKVVNSVISRLIKVGGKVASLFTALLAASMILYSGYVLYDTLYIQNQAFSNGWELLKYRPEIIDDGEMPLSPETLAAVNKDYRAWLTIYKTNIDYPVMQGKDNYYYARHDYLNKSSLTGALYLDSGNSKDFSDNYNIIYGHYMDSEALFGGLKNYADKDYFKKHQTGVLVLPKAVYDVTIFAAMEDDAYNPNIYTVGNRNIKDLLSFIKNSNPLQYDAAAAKGAKKIVAFSTCQSAETDGRLIVFAVLKERDLSPEQIPDDPDPGTDGGGPVIPGGGGGPGPDGGGGGKTPDGGGGTPDSGGDKPDIIDIFTPTGGVHGDDCWALVNLICVFVTIFIFIPILSIRAKYRRGKMMQDVNEEKEGLATMPPNMMDADDKMCRKQIVEAAIAEKAAAGEAQPPRINGNGLKLTKEEFNNAVEKVFYKVKGFKKHFTVGIILEIILVIIAIVAFILTEDMRLPMVLIDKWTPLMLIIVIVTLLVDIFLVRYRGGVEADTEEQLENEQNGDPKSPQPQG